MQLVGVDAVGHRHARNRGSGLPAGFNGALLEFETVGPSGGHIVSAKIKRTPTSVRLTKRLRFSTSVQDGVPRTLTITQWKTQLLENAAGVFASAAEKQSAIPDIKELHAKIGLQALEIDFLAGALGRMGDASAKR